MNDRSSREQQCIPRLDTYHVTNNHLDLDLPSDSNSESSFRPISSLYNRHFTPHIASGSIEDLMRVSVIRGTIVGMVVSSIMRMFVRHADASKRTRLICTMKSGILVIYEHEINVYLVAEGMLVDEVVVKPYLNAHSTPHYVMFFVDASGQVVWHG